MKALKIYLVLAFVVAAAFVTAGCIAKYELPTNCNLDLEWYYEFDNPGEESLPSKVGNIAVYAFDQRTKLLVDIIYIDGDDIRRGHVGATLPNGTYTFVCWATNGDDMTTGGYFPAHMYDPADHEHSAIEIGRTSYNEFRMMLECYQLPSYVQGDVSPKNAHFDDLYFSIKTDVVIDGKGNIVVPFNFICDTSVLRVRVGGLEHVSGATRAVYTPNVFVTAPHERYEYDNSLADYSREVRFELPATYVAVDTMAVDIKVHRLELDTYRDRPVMLYLQDPDTGNNIIDPIDVLAAILEATDLNGNHPYESQDDIDKQYEFDININLDATSGPGSGDDYRLKVTVTVDGYRVINLSPDV